MVDRQNMSELGRVWRQDASPLMLQLIDDEVTPQEYGKAMLALGAVLGKAFVQREDVRAQTVLVVSTVEDADYFAKGFAESLIEAGTIVVFACLWLDRTAVNMDGEQDIVQIVAEFIEPVPAVIDHFIALTSIIASSCVIRCAIMRLLDETSPEFIHVAAPVVLEGTQQRLSQRFSPEISDRFRYWYLAEDSAKDDLGNVRPGIGGNLYQRLGLVDQATKNRMMPTYVTERIAARQTRTADPRLG